MTALERAATTVAACLVDAPVDPAFSMADVNGWTEEKAYEIARAVLLAVRDLPTEFISKQRGQLYRTEFLDCDFTAMIDAILNEKDTTND